jgi:hypothetical protein
MIRVLPVLAGMLVGCAASHNVAAPAVRLDPSPVERAYPAAVWVPAGASYAVLARSVAHAAFALRELVTPVWLAATSSTPAQIDAELRAWLGFSPLQPAELAAIGVDPAGGFAAYATELSPTLVVAVADRDRLRTFVDRRRPAVGATAREIGGIAMTAWQLGGGAALWLAELDGWLAVHVSEPDTELDPAAWVHALLAARAGANAARALGVADSIAVARQRLAPGSAMPSLVGLARADAIAASVSERFPAAGRCASVLALATGEVVFGAELEPDAAVRVVGVVELGLPLAAQLGGAVAPSPPAGYAAYRERAGVFAAYAVDAGLVARLARAAGCAALAPRFDPLALLADGDGVAAVHVAAEELSVRDLRARGALWLALRERRPVDRQLARVPSLMKRRATVAGERLGSIEAMGMFPRVLYRLTDDQLLMGVGRGVMELMLTTAPGPEPAARWLLGAGIRPSGVADLGALVGGLFELAGGYAGAAAQGALRALARYEHAAAWLELEPRAIVLRLHMRLRR